jgi:NADH dehydrogenase
MPENRPCLSPLAFDVVIVGGGFSGVFCARALEQKLGPEAKRRVAIVAEENFMVFQPMLPEIAGSALAPRHVVNPIRRLCGGATVLRAKVRDIDLPGRKILLDAGDFTENTAIGFEHLVLALGGVVDLSRVPGMPEHAYLMKNVGDALRLRGAIIDRFEEANLVLDLTEQKRLLTFVIVGGGYSGVETAGQVFDLAKEMVEAYTRVRADSLRVVLIHSGPHLLPEISQSLGKYAEENLRRRGVEIVLNTRVLAMTAGRVMLGEGREIDSHTVVSTVGNAPNPILTELCKRHQIACEKGRIITEATMLVAGHERLWSAGDCAAVPMKVPAGDGEKAATSAPASQSAPFVPQKYCPPTAQFAQRQGTVMGKNIACALKGSSTLEPFTFTGLGELASIGHKAAVAEILGLKFQGFFAWWLWRTIYLMKLPGLERKLRVIVDWTLDLFFPRDIALFQPKPTQLLKEMHLEKGDILFHAGDPAWSLYIVKSGALELRLADGSIERTVAQGEQIGRKTLTERRPWRFTATATEATTLVAVSGKVFETVANSGASIDEVFGPTGK